MKKFLLILWCVSFVSVYAYTPSTLEQEKAQSLSQKINEYITSLSATRKEKILRVFLTQLPVLQARLISTVHVERMYLIEYMRRHLPGVKNIDVPHLIDDDTMGFTWTHAPFGFKVLYYPSPVPAFGSLDFSGVFSTIINGSYFSRLEGGVYPAGLLLSQGQVYTEFVPDDKQLTHIYCRTKNSGSIFLKNSEYVSEEDILARCDEAFQAGPMIYEKYSGTIYENTMPKTYIGSAHARTVMVVFEKENNEQDMWFLTVYSKMTLAQVRDVVLSETRFIGTYKNISVLNLDGGSSVAYKSNKFPELNFGKNKTLPIIFGIQ